GVTVAGFPNLFLLYGPNTNLGHSSIVYMLESQAEHVIRLLELSDNARNRTIEVREEAQRGYADRMDRQLANTVWNQGCCSSWFFGGSGRNARPGPTFTCRYREQLRDVDPSDFVIAWPARRRAIPLGTGQKPRSGKSRPSSAFSATSAIAGW